MRCRLRFCCWFCHQVRLNAGPEASKLLTQPRAASDTADTAAQDNLLAKQTAAGMRASFAPKLAGAAALQLHGAATPVRAWALFSSIAGLIGSSGQANYAAANATLDAWAISLHSQVLPGPLADSSSKADFAFLLHLETSLMRSCAAVLKAALQAPDGCTVLVQCNAC